MIDLIEYAEDEVIKNLLVFDPALFIDGIDPGFNIRAFEIQAGIEH